MKKLILIFLLFTANLAAQAPNPDAILNKVKEKFMSVKDYRADVHIKVDVEFLKVPESDAQILFKQPDKFRVKSQQFAMLPKEGFRFSPMEFTRFKYTAVYIREEMLDGAKTAVIKVIPMDDTNKIILSTVWVDMSNYVIRKVESTTRDGGTFTIEMKYDKKLTSYPLPSSQKFSFDLKNRKTPKNPMSHNKPQDNGKKNDKVTGKVYVTYKSYKVNTGISDKEFTGK